MPTLEDALDQEDPARVAAAADEAELKKLIMAEELFDKRHSRKKRSTRVAIASQALVGYVALAGFFANAYQNYNNKLETERRAVQEEERWKNEFKRAQDADHYRAFFETSALVTDAQNQSKRLVGYALLKEFVADKDYNGKATLMLEESLAQELRTGSPDDGVNEQRRASIVAILSALAESSDCRSLERAARTVDKLAKHHARTGNVDESQEVFQVYVHKVFGRGVAICPNFKDLRRVREPIRETLMRQPALGDVKTKLTPASANTRIAELLRDDCNDEAENGLSDCPDIWAHYKTLCAQADAEEKDACAVVNATSFSAAASQPAAP
jgi:hypothetical protein